MTCFDNWIVSQCCVIETTRAVFSNYTIVVCWICVLSSKQSSSLFQDYCSKVFGSPVILMFFFFPSTLTILTEIKQTLNTICNGSDPKKKNQINLTPYIFDFEFVFQSIKAHMTQHHYWTTTVLLGSKYFGKLFLLGPSAVRLIMFKLWSRQYVELIFSDPIPVALN